MRSFRPCTSLPPMLRSSLRQSIYFWVLRGRGAFLHYGGNSPPLWREYPSTAKNMLSAFVCGCLLLPLPSLLRPVGRCSVHTPSLCTCSHLRFWVSRGRGLSLHYGVNSPPLWREYPSTAKNMLSAFVCGCLFLCLCVL